jgi:hypothetical protein
MRRAIPPVFQQRSVAPPSQPPKRATVHVVEAALPPSDDTMAAMLQRPMPRSQRSGNRSRPIGCVSSMSSQTTMSRSRVPCPRCFRRDSPAVAEKELIDAGRDGRAAPANKQVRYEGKHHIQSARRRCSALRACRALDETNQQIAVLLWRPLILSRYHESMTPPPAMRVWGL